MPLQSLVRGASALAVLATLLPAAASADAGLGDCTAHGAGRAKTLDLCLGSLKGLVGPHGGAQAAAPSAGLPTDQSGDPASDSSGDDGGWSVSGSLLPNLSDPQPRDGVESTDADRLLQSLRLQQFMVRLNRSF